MSFLVFEQDPLVRKDICETLEAEFAGQTIVIVETLAGLEDMALALSGPTVAVLAKPSGIAEISLGKINNMSPGIRCVIIGDRPAGDDRTDDGCVYLQRPFSSGSLIGSVRVAMSDLSVDPADS